MIRYAFMRRADRHEAERVATDAERIGNGKTPAGNGWNGSETLSHKEKNKADSSSSIGEVTAESVPAVPSIPQKGSQHSASIPEAGRSAPDLVQYQILKLESSLAGNGADVFSGHEAPAWVPGKTLRERMETHYCFIVRKLTHYCCPFWRTSPLALRA